MCDFDGTISNLCLCDFLYEQFAACGLKYSELWAKGKVGTREEIILSFQHIKASRYEMEKALKTVPVKPGFKKFYDYCFSCGYNLVIVSDGLEWAIRCVLNQMGIKNIDVKANQISFEDDRYDFNFPYHSSATPNAGVCKQDIALDFKHKYEFVYLIGDGRTDFGCAQVVDFVFACDELQKYCKEFNIPSFHFNDFFDILDHLQKTNNPK